MAAFVEDCATAAFDCVRDNATPGTCVAEPARRSVATQVREGKNDLASRALADDGGKRMLVQYRDSVLRDYVSPINAPSAEHVDALFHELVGMARGSDSWRRFKMTSAPARARLQVIIRLRGASVHRTKATRSVLKNDVREAADLPDTHASIRSNVVRDYEFDLVGKDP